MTDDYNPLALALHDAATNCERDGAIATLTLHSGKQFSGSLKKQPGGFSHARDCQLRKPDGGWATILIPDLAAVEVSP